MNSNYFYVLNYYPVHLATKESEVCHSTVIDYYNYCREVCVVSLAENIEQIGGPGKIVEIDESKFFKRKYNRGRLLGSQQDGWVFGGIQRDNKKIFMVRVPRRNKETLLPIIHKFIKPGTLIVSDEWKAYWDLSEQGYEHESVCHKNNFVSPTDSRVHTQNIEISWRYAKNIYPDNSTSENLRDSYLQEFLYRKKYSTELVCQFFRDIRR